MDPATLFKHMLNLHVFPAMSTAPNHPTGNTAPASRQRCNESNPIEKGSLSPLPFLAWRVWLRDGMRELCKYGDSHITKPTGEKPQTRLQRLEINATLLVPVIPWQHPTAQMETLGNKTSQACLHFSHKWMVKVTWDGHGSPFPLESVVC